MKSIRLNQKLRHQIYLSFRTAQRKTVPQHPTGLNTEFTQRVEAEAKSRSDELKEACKGTELFDLLKKGGRIDIEDMVSPEGRGIADNYLYLSDDYVLLPYEDWLAEMKTQFLQEVDDHLYEEYEAERLAYRAADAKAIAACDKFLDIVDASNSTKQLLAAEPDAIKHFPQHLVEAMKAPVEPKKKRENVLKPDLPTFTI